jgi:hypothetical protein
MRVTKNSEQGNAGKVGNPNGQTHSANRQTKTKQQIQPKHQEKQNPATQKKKLLKTTEQQL